MITANIKLILKILISFIIVITFSDDARAQMFSVGEQNSSAVNTFTDFTSISIGWEFGDFSYSGESNIEELALRDRFDFNAGIYRILFESPGLKMYLGAAGNATGMDDQNYFNIGAVLSNDFIISRSENLLLLLPIQIGTDLKRSHKEGSGQQFQQSSFLGGGGLGFRTNLSSGIELLTKIIPNYGFSFSQGNIFGGNIFTVNGVARVYLKNILPNRSLVLGYNYDYRSYDVDGDNFDYDFSGHTISLGVTF